MPSRSESSSRRSSSRRSSSRGKSSRKKNSLKKSVAQNGVNFWAMLTGFVCGLTVLFLIINLFTRDAINPDLLNTNDQNRAEVATRVQRQDFNTFVEQANIGQLVATLKSLQQVNTFEDGPAYRTNYERQQRIVDAMSEQTLSKEHRQLSILANINSTSSAFWTDQKNPLGLADLGIRLREITVKHENSSDPEIAFLARLELARLNSTEAADRAVSHSRELYQLLADYPENEQVHRVITRSLMDVVASSEKRASTTKILDHFLNQPKITGNQDTQNLYLLLSDLWTLCDHNFFDVQENLLYTAKAGRDQMRDVCLNLAKVSTAGNEVSGHIGLTGIWMEKNGHYTHAIDIYEAWLACGSRLPNQEDVAKVQRQAEWGIRRCKAVGKPFNLAINTYDGKPLKLSSIESMPVLIVFWSDTDNTEEVLEKVANASGRWQRNSVKIIAVQVEKDFGLFDRNSTAKKKAQRGRWEFCYDDGSGNGPLFSQVPSGKNGRVVLLDRQHRLYNVDVGLDELVTTVKKVLAIRDSEG